MEESEVVDKVEETKEENIFTHEDGTRYINIPLYKQVHTFLKLSSFSYGPVYVVLSYVLNQSLNQYNNDDVYSAI